MSSTGKNREIAFLLKRAGLDLARVGSYLIGSSSTECCTHTLRSKAPQLQSVVLLRKQENSGKQNAWHQFATTASTRKNNHYESPMCRLTGIGVHLNRPSERHHTRPYPILEDSVVECRQMSPDVASVSMISSGKRWETMGKDRAAGEALLRHHGIFHSHVTASQA